MPKRRWQQCAIAIMIWPSSTFPSKVFPDLALSQTSLRYYPELPILVMSMHEESLYAERSLRLGARGYIMKHQATINIQSAIRRILDGGIYLSDEMHKLILERIRTHAVDPG